MKKLFVGKLSYSSTEASLLSLFEQFGPVISAKIIKDPGTGQSRGFGFVELEDNARADDAVTQLNGQSLDGREIVVSEARDDRRGGAPSSGSRGFGGFGGGSRGGRSGTRRPESRGYSGGNRY